VSQVLGVPWRQYLQRARIPLAALAAAGLLALTPVQARLTTWLSDVVLTLAPPPARLQSVLVLDLDEPSIQQLRGSLGSWPYTRDAYVPLVNYLRRAGAEVVAFNMLFSDARSGDDEFAALLGPQSRVVLGVAGLRAGLETASDAPVARAASSLTIDALAGAPAFRWPALAWPSETLRAAAQGAGALGVMSAPLDADDRLRRLPVLHSEESFVLPAFPVAALLAGDPGSQLRYDPSRQHYTAGAHEWAVDARGSFRVPVPDHGGVDVVRYARVHRAATGAVTDAELEQRVRGRAVFIGSSAFSGYSVATTRGMVSGTELQALAYAHLKAGTVLRPAGPALAALVLGLALLPSLLGMRQRTPLLREPVLLALGVAACLLGLACAASVWWQQELPLATASTVLALALLLAALVHARWVQNNQRNLALDRAVAEAANRAKGEFLAIVSHEIRTPIHAVMGIGELLAETPLSEEQRAHLAVLRRAGDNLSALINDLLDLARIDAGRLELDPAPFELRPVLEQQLAVVFVGAISKGLQLHLDVAPDVPDCVLGDRKRLAQALLNLLGNAVKFTQQGNVTLAVRREPGQSEVLRFQVRDTGMGIAPERCESIFEPFTQADGSVTRNYGGSGLGLTITRRLVNLMGGEIELVSALGEGSIFTFTACLPSSSMNPSQAPPAPPPAPTGLRILLAEDQAANAYLLQAMLRPGGHAIDVAANGQLAVQNWRERPYDVVLMDLQMPVLDGLGATREIRLAEAAEGRQRTPIIAISAHAFETDVQRSLDTGCDAHLNKPVAKSDLLAALGRHVPRPAGTAPPPPAPAPAQQPEAALDPALARLAAEPGFEVQAALRRMGGDEAAFITALGLAMPSLDAWHVLLVQQQQTCDAIVAHDIKGVCTMMGAGSLAQAAHELESALRSGQTEEQTRARLEAVRLAVGTTREAVARTVRAVAQRG
jgi:signal transduction histidine kinase/CheY-like chemotaxis protein/HPt (histidine-containing phosphotransfer) domain-containing protein